MLTNAYIWVEGGVKILPNMADIICEQSFVLLLYKKIMTKTEIVTQLIKTKIVTKLKKNLNCDKTQKLKL